jgi:hypothetical protein
MYLDSGRVLALVGFREWRTVWNASSDVPRKAIAPPRLTRLRQQWYPAHRLQDLLLITVLPVPD